MDGKCRVLLHDVDTGDAVELGPREWVLISGADGTRDLEGIAIAAEREGVKTSRASVAQMLADLDRAGMLAEGPAPKSAAWRGPQREEGEALAKVPRSERPVVHLPGYAFQCDGHGSCCQLYATVVFSPLEAARARSVRPDVLDGGDRHEHVFTPERGSGPCAGSAVALVDGRCAYLEGSLCGLHRKAGPESKPIGCNLFPLSLVDDGTRVRASVAVECACVLESLGKPGGAPILDPAVKTRGEIDPAIVVDELPPDVTVAGDVRAPIEAYLPWSDAALSALDSSDDPALAAWALAAEIEANGLDPERAKAVVRASPPLEGHLAAHWLAALADKAARRAKAQNTWRSPRDLCRRGVSIVAASAGLLADPDVLAAVAAGAGAAHDEEAFYLRVALFGHQMVGYPLAVALRDRAVAIWVARTFPLAAEALYPGDEDPAFRHPIALVEALLRGHGLRRYTDAVADEREHARC